MARIRTIKPEFFRHEELQELEANNPGHYPMLVFSGLFTQCDKNGVFEWRPRMLALDILPFLWRGSIGEALGKTLELLRDEGFIKQLEMDGKQYGFIPSFAEHQRISGKEAQGKPKNPEPSEMIEVLQGKHRGSTGEAPGIPGRERKGKEGNGVLLGAITRILRAVRHRDNPEHEEAVPRSSSGR